MRAGICLLVLLLPYLAARGAEAEFSGRWSLEVRIPAEPLIGLLELEHTDGGWNAFVEGGPAPVTITGDRIDLLVDSRDRQGFRFQRRLTGTLQDGMIAGTMHSIDVVESAAEFGEDGSTWTARPFTDTAPEVPIRRLEQLDGIWAPLRGLDFRKWTMALTPAAAEWHAGYDARMDEPQKRCMSPGLYAAITWSFPFEVVVDNDKLVLLYEAFNLSRRVFIDGREDPEFFPNSSMGYSTARLQNGELIVETRLLAQTVRDFNGEPISENATLTERYRLSHGGDRLSVVLTLHDPENYARDPIRRRAWTRETAAVIYPFECDPDSFFRQLFNEGRMQEYIDRSPRRP